MPSDALLLFERLCAQVEKVRAAAAQEGVRGDGETAAVMLRACIVMTVAALDAYMHERGVEMLVAHARTGAAEARAVAGFLGRLRATDVSGTSAAGLIRYRLSYQTLTGPNKIDKLLESAGHDCEDVWLKVAMAAGTRPDRMRRQTELQTDRRNQIAHEADWDPVALDFRHIDDAHVADCLAHVRAVAANMDAAL
jgi:hypothetical protein